jgi:hypothetical protein
VTEREPDIYSNTHNILFKIFRNMDFELSNDSQNGDRKAIKIGLLGGHNGHNDLKLSGMYRDSECIHK